MNSESPERRTYSYLGPAGTFTEAALAQVAEARGQEWRSVHNVGQALDDVLEGRSTAAMIAIENSIEGGVSNAQDALATLPGLRIIGEYLVPVNFVLVARPGTKLEDVRVVNAHPVAYAQCYRWLNEELPTHVHVPALSNVASAASLLDGTSEADAAIAPPGIVAHYDLEVLASEIGDNANAVTRFVLVSRTAPSPEPTGADKTSLIAELPEDGSGALLSLLEQPSEHHPVSVPGEVPSLPFTSNVAKDKFIANVQASKKFITAGDIIQVVGSQRFSVETKASPLDVYRAARSVNPSPRHMPCCQSGSPP